MSFSVSEDNGSMEWGGTSLWSFVGSWSRLCKPWFWRLAFDVVRFNFFATDIFSEKAKSCRTRQDETFSSDAKKQRKLESVGEYLDRKRYSEQFKRYYLIPTTAAPWCMSPADVCQDFPIETLAYFMFVLSLYLNCKILTCPPRVRHRFNTVTGGLKWRSFKNGSKTYVDAF
jgi:predicted NAD/FAD-binding protein